MSLCTQNQLRFDTHPVSIEETLGQRPIDQRNQSIPRDLVRYSEV